MKNDFDNIITLLVMGVILGGIFGLFLAAK
jgi:hypothetical protein